MELVVYHQEFERINSMDDFLRIMYSSRMKYLASDLLKKGLSPVDIANAMRRAMTVAKAGGLNVAAHFMPMYTQFDDGIMQDCKLSHLGYALILMNARPDLASVGKWQLKVLKKFFNSVS